MDPVQIEHQARLRDLDTYLAINGSLPEVMLDSRGNPIYALTDGGERRYGGADPGTTIAFDPWLLSERRVRIGLRDYLGNMDGVRLLPNKHTLDLDVPQFQTVEPYSNTAGTVRNFADNGNGYNGGNGYRPLDNGGITPADNSGITPVNGSDGPANINSFQNLNFSPDTESQPNNLPNTPDATAPDWQPVEEGNVSKNAELSSPDSFTNEPDGGMVENNDLEMEEFEREAKKIGYGTLSNVDARKWYLNCESKISSLIDISQSVEQQARKAFLLRNQARTQARKLMKDRELAEKLNLSEGNATWSDLYRKYYDMGYRGDDIYLEIIKSAQRSRQSVNEALGLGDRK